MVTEDDGIAEGYAPDEAVEICVTHPTQSRFTCPAPRCQLTYTTLPSLVRHVGVSHKAMVLSITFKCAMCEYTHSSKKSTSLHFRHAHGVAPPPMEVDGSNEKACPFCSLTFPSKRSCSNHIREKHMDEACSQRAKEAAEKEAESGQSAARSKWSQGEVDRFKAALARFGPESNIKIAAEIGSRSAKQVNVYKCRFLKAFPDWLKENYHPPPSQSPSSAVPSPKVGGPIFSAAPSTVKRTAVEEERTPSPPPVPISEKGGQALDLLDRVLETLGIAGSPIPTRARVVRPPSPPPVPSAAIPLAPASTPLLARVSERQHSSPEVGVACPPSPPPVPSAAIPLAPASTPLLARVSERQHSSPEVGVACPPSPLPVPSATIPLAPASTPLLARVSERQHSSPEVGVACPPSPPPVPSAAIPLAPASTPLLARVSERQHSSPEVGVACPPSPPPVPFAAIPLAPASTPPLARVSERQHSSPEVGVACPLPIPSAAPLAPAFIPSPPVGSVSTTSVQPSINLDNLDETLRMPFQQELLPFSDRLLGEFEWIAFEEVLRRWSTVIKDVVSAHHRRPPNPTSQWARRRRGRRSRQPEAHSPSPPSSLPADPSPHRDEQATPSTPLGNRASGRARHAAKAKYLQRFYHTNPGACMRRLLENGPPVYCKIAEADLVGHFTAAMAEPPPVGPPPTWLFSHQGENSTLGGVQTNVEGDILHDPFTPEEVLAQFRRTKRSAPGVDGISYANWRWVDPRGLILATIYNICRINTRVPSPWKHSAVTLIHKGGDTASIRNWRPISLQLTIYKLYSALIARRIASWAITTSAFSPAQKGFLGFDGCTEHNFLLRSMLTDSRRHKQNLILVWLDLREAFPSVPHDLMRLMMERLGLSGSIIQTVSDIYSNASVSIRTGRDSYTSHIPQKRGVKQGCPLSPILFNIVLEGLLRHLSNSEAGYTLAGSKLNSLAYADDICVTASTNDDVQELLDRCVTFTEWAGFKFNAKKCGSLCLVNRSSPIYVDHLFSPRLGADNIPALTWDERYKYLGCPIGASRDNSDDLATLRDSLLRDTSVIFQSPLAEWQKLDAFRRFLFPRLTFALKVILPGPTWCKKLDTSLRAIIKRGLRIPQRTCTQYFYLPQALGGMGIPSVLDESHVARAAQAFKFLADTRDPVIRQVALHQLGEAVTKRARHLDPSNPEHLAEFLNSTAHPGEGRAGDLWSLWSSARASLAIGGAFISLTQDSATLQTDHHHITWVKRKLASQAMKETIGARHLAAIKTSSDQGRAFNSLSLHADSSFFTYSGAFLTFPQYRFIHKARLNLLPVRTVQARCHQHVPTTQCRICGRVPETLAHVLNHCHRNLGMIRDRHNSILERIVRAVPESVGTKMKEQPQPGTSGDNRPDLTIISPDESSVIIVEVSCPFEGSPTALEDAARTKLEKYEPLRQTLLQRYTSVEVLPFIVGSLGSWYPPNDRVLSSLRIGHRYASLMRRLCVISAISGSQSIWYHSMCTRRRGNPDVGAAELPIPPAELPMASPHLSPCL